MPDLVISALISSVTVVRLLKGTWLRYPQFLAAAMIGSVVLSPVAEKLDPGSADSMINAPSMPLPAVLPAFSSLAR